jgi:hypothetical protein
MVSRPSRGCSKPTTRVSVSPLFAWSSRLLTRPVYSAAGRADDQEGRIIRATDAQSSLVGHVNPRSSRVVTQRQGPQANPEKLRIHDQMPVKEIRSVPLHLLGMGRLDV